MCEVARKSLWQLHPCYLEVWPDVKGVSSQTTTLVVFLSPKVVQKLMYQKKIICLYSIL